MPGLVDTHVHLDNTAGEKSEGFERGLAVMLAHSITTARELSACPRSRACAAASNAAK
jgi:dihydroorotase-like cyclic amidohydrolase